MYKKVLELTHYKYIRARIFREFMINGVKLYVGNKENIEFVKTYVNTFLEKKNDYYRSIASHIASIKNIDRILSEANLIDKLEHKQYGQPIIENTKWKFPVFDNVEEIVGYNELDYEDGIKLYYHKYKSLQTYCDKYIPAEFWETILAYEVRVKEDKEDETHWVKASRFEKSKQQGEILIIGKHGTIDFDRIEIVETITERTWYNRFKEALPILEEEYKKLVAAGEIDESDVVVYE